MSVPWCLVLANAGIILQISITEAGYCYRSYACGYQGYESQRYTESCGFLGWDSCGHYRQIGVTHYRTCYQTYCCSGYTGNDCSQAICHGSTSCPNGGSCVLPEICVCLPGFIGSTCTDENECVNGTHNCQQLCINTHGSFSCACEPGFLLNYDNTTCTDVNECDDVTHNCQQLCTNTIGSFNCSCESGFLLNSDNATCTDINECLEKNGGCSQICSNTNGSFECSCEDGLYLASDGETCLDIDECEANNGGCEHICTNEYTTFRCSCNRGYRFDLNESCVDIDECAESHICSHQCNNTVGTYNCSCYQGFELSDDGGTCLDIDDCVNVTCLHGGSCIDFPNTFKCQCLQGYENIYCQSDINECLFANGGCEDQCINTNGSFYCQCREDSFLEEDGVSCRGDSVAPTVFQKYQIPRRLLPRGCMFVSLMSCRDSGTGLSLMLTSTDKWYRLNMNQSILYTYGIVFAEVGDLSVPVSIAGMKVVSTGDNFEIVTASSSYKEEEGTELTDRHNDDCLSLSLTPKDIHDFISSGSFLGTFFDRIQDKLPSWLQFSKSGVGLISVTDLKTDLIYGKNIDSLPECIGSPVFKDRLYTVFRFGTDMSFSIYGDRIHVPAPFEGEKFCIIIDICHNMGGTIFLMIPQESRNLLDKSDYFIELAKNGLRLRPKGIGLSLMREINVHYKTSELNLWNGDEMFRYRIFKDANIWVDSDIGYTSTGQDLDVQVYASTEIFLKGPSITNFLLDLFVEEWSGLIRLKKFSVTPTVRFTIGDTKIKLSFEDILIASLEVYFSIGGERDRVLCGNEANPPGIFASFLLIVNPFRSIPIVGDWIFDTSIRVHAFKTTGNIVSLETKTYILNEITGLKAMLYKLRISSDDFSNKMIGELSSVLQQAVILLQSSISELQTILAEISNGNDSLRVILKVIKNLWEKYNKLKNDARNLQDNIEFQTSDLVKNFTDNIESEITRVGWNINRAIEKVTNQIFSSIGSSNEVGFRFRAFVKIIVYEFAYMEIELVKSEESMGKCSKFKKVYELMSDVKATRVVCHIPFIPGPSANLVRIRLGYFLLYEHHSYLSLAIGSDDKFVAHIHAHVYILGMQVSGDLLISNNGIYIHIEGNIWNIFLAKIEMSAELGKKWFELTFRLKGSFLASSQEPIHVNTHGFQGSYLDGIRSIARQIGESASDRLQAAQYSLSAAQRVLVSANERITETQKKIKQCNANFDSAIYSLESAKRKLDEVKAPYDRALEKLRKAQRNVNNLCRIRSCPSICIPGVKCGCGWIPCCGWTSCMIRVPDLSCEAANVVCSAVRAVAYTALEAVQILVRIPMIAFDVAKAVLTGAQVVVDKARIVLDVAVALLEVAKTGLEMAEVGLEIAKGAIELLKVTLSAALHVFDYLVLGIQQIIDVKNCGFEIEMSIKDKAFFEMSCEVKAFGLDWKTFRFWFDFRHPVTSMWRVAKGTVSSLLDSITDIFGKRKRRDISFKVMSKLHHIFKLFKRDASDYAGNKSEHLSNTIFKTLYNHSNSNTLNEYDNRVLLFQENCLSFRTVYSFLSNASIQLLNLSNKTVSQLNNISRFSDPTLNITTESLIYNLTIESSGISAEYALKDYNLTYEDLNAILDEVKNNFTDDPLITEINEVKNVAKEMIQSGINEANALAVVQFWIYELENTTTDYFKRTDCAHFRDCVLHSMSLLYGLFIDDSIENAVLNRQLTSSIEDILQPLLTNDSVPVTQTYQMSLKLLEHLTSMNNSNMFCSTPPTFVSQPQNQTVLSGSQIYLYCNVLGDPSPNIYWYLNDSLMENETREELKIEESTKQNTGSYRCIAENVVTNITSGDALILVKECPPGTFYDVSTCQVCSKGSYQRSWNKIECNACPTGFTTSTTVSPSEMECVDINECTDQLSVCQQVCINTNGSYYCQCGRNYNLGKDGKTCSENYTSIFISVGITAGILSLALVMSIKIWKTRHVRKMKIRTHGVRVKSSKQENVYDADPTNTKRSNFKLKK